MVKFKKKINRANFENVKDVILSTRLLAAEDVDFFKKKGFFWHCDFVSENVFGLFGDGLYSSGWGGTRSEPNEPGFGIREPM